mmetsp:Transcript_17322/g.60918  ORF Transcript_17322/g.60918 Transcript_17322/m.60918 type:complete len:444 (-) Transcript_17322:1090-2421(-)
MRSPLPPPPPGSVRISERETSSSMAPKLGSARSLLSSDSPMSSPTPPPFTSSAVAGTAAASISALVSISPSHNCRSRASVQPPEKPGAVSRSVNVWISVPVITGDADTRGSSPTTLTRRGTSTGHSVGQSKNVTVQTYPSTSSPGSLSTASRVTKNALCRTLGSVRNLLSILDPSLSAASSAVIATAWASMAVVVSTWSVTSVSVQPPAKPGESSSRVKVCTPVPAGSTRVAPSSPPSPLPCTTVSIHTAAPSPSSPDVSSTDNGVRSNGALWNVMLHTKPPFGGRSSRVTSTDMRATMSRAGPSVASSASLASSALMCVCMDSPRLLPGSCVSRSSAVCGSAAWSMRPVTAAPTSPPPPSPSQERSRPRLKWPDSGESASVVTVCTSSRWLAYVRSRCRSGRPAPCTSDATSAAASSASSDVVPSARASSVGGVLMKGSAHS